MDVGFSRPCVGDFAVSLVLGLAFTSAPDYLSTGDCKFDAAYLFASFVLAFLFFFTGRIARNFLYEKSIEEDLQRFSFMTKILGLKHPQIVIAVIILCFWAPVIFMLLPGTCCNDTWGQLRQFLGETPLKDHHPVLDTFIISGIIVNVKKMTGSWHWGMAVYISVQAVITSLVFAYTIVYSKIKLKLQNQFLFLCLSIYCILPFYAANVQGISKDALFSWIYVLFLVQYIELVRTSCAPTESLKFNITLLATSIFCCLTKKVGVYIIVPSLALLLPFYSRRWKMLLTQILVPVILMCVLMPCFLQFFSIEPGGRQEKYSLFFQQTARYVKLHDEEISPKEHAAIDKLLRYSDLADRYRPTNADNAKSAAFGVSAEAYNAWRKVWLHEGLRHPGTYIDAANCMLAGWFSFSEYKPLMNMNWHNQIPKNSSSAVSESITVRNAFFTKTSDFVQKSYDRIAGIPVINILFGYGFYAALVPAFLFMLLIRLKSKEHICCVAAMFPNCLSIILGCWLAPVSVHLEGTRYLLPVVYATPLMIMWTIYSVKNFRDVWKTQ